MTGRPRWLRNDPIEPSRRSSHARSARDDGPERNYTVTASLGPFGNIAIPWEGTSPDDVVQSFLEFMTNDVEFGIPNYPNFRTLWIKFNGKTQLVAFKRDWFSGFAIS